MSVVHLLGFGFGPLPNATERRGPTGDAPFRIPLLTSSHLPCLYNTDDLSTINCNPFSSTDA